MVHKAQEWIEKNGFDFIITGEVVGQRPMSQRKDTMPVVARESGAEDRLLRPLSAKNLPATLAEREGWIKREAMHDFSGRNRKPQMALAAHYGFVYYASPAGGCCFLTDENYSKKLVDLWQARGKRDYEMDDIMLLKVGRHMICLYQARTAWRGGFSRPLFPEGRRRAHNLLVLPERIPPLEDESPVESL